MSSGSRGRQPTASTAELVLGNKERGPGDTLGIALARSRAADARQARDEAAARRDPDEAAASLVSRGYRPGMITELSMKLADCEARLADEEAKIKKTAKRAEWTRRAHERGQIDGFGVAARMQDADEGDQATVERLQRRAASIRRQITEVSEVLSPPQQREQDPLEQAASRANQAFREMTRQRMAEAQQSRPQARPPFASRAAADAADAEHTGTDCQICAEGRRRDAARSAAAAGEYKVPPGSEYIGPAITRTLRADEDGVYGNHAQPVIYR